MACGKTKLTRGFLLQSGRREGRLWIASDRLGLNGLDGKFAGFHCKAGLLCIPFSFQIHLVELLAKILDQTGIKFLALMLHASFDGPIFLRTERLDFAFAFND